MKKEEKTKKKLNKKTKILILGLIVLLIVGIIIYLVFFNTHTEKTVTESEVAVDPYLSYDINEDCLKYISGLDEVTYDTISSSDYADTLYLYNTIYEEDIAIEEQYLVCLTNIVYVTENETVETDLAEAIAADNTLIDVLNESLLVSNVFTDEQNMSVVMLTRTLDITAPELVLKEVSIKTTGSYDINSFIESCTDDTDTECSLSYENEDMANYSSAGTYDITIIATDSSGNTTSASTTLTITKATTSSNNSSSNNTNSSGNNSSNNSTSSTNSTTDTSTSNNNTSTSTDTSTSTCDVTGWKNRIQTEVEKGYLVFYTKDEATAFGKKIMKAGYGYYITTMAVVFLGYEDCDGVYTLEIYAPNVCTPSTPSQVSVGYSTFKSWYETGEVTLGVFDYLVSQGYDCTGRTDPVSKTKY